MTLPLPWAKLGDPQVQENFERIAQQFPLVGQNVVGGVSGTTFPTSPSNGMDFYYEVDTDTTWHFKYRTATTKWHFVGGPPMYAVVNTSEGTASAVYTALVTAGPSLTTPLAGDYVVEWGSNGVTNASPAVTLHSLDIGGTAATDTESVRGGVNTTQASTSRSARKSGLAASTAIVSKYKTTAGIGLWEQRWLKITPIKVG